MRWANGVRFSIDYDRKKIGLGDLNVESSQSKIKYVDPNGDNDILAGEIAEASKYIAGFRSEYETISGEEDVTARDNGKLVARIADIFKININNAPADNLKIRNKKGFVFNNHSEFTPDYNDTHDNSHIDGTQIRFITKPKESLDGAGVSIHTDGTEGILDSSTLMFDSYIINNDGQPEETGEMSSFDIKSLTFETRHARSVISLNSVKFQPVVQTVELYNTVLIDSSGIHTHVSYNYDSTTGNRDSTPFYPSGYNAGLNYEGDYKSSPIIVPSASLKESFGEECFYYVINLTKELKLLFPQATQANMNSIDDRFIHETGPEYKLSVKTEQWDTTKTYMDNNGVHYHKKEEHVYIIDINLGEWFNTTTNTDGNIIYDNSSEVESTKSEKPYYSLNNYPTNITDKLVLFRDKTPYTPPSAEVTADPPTYDPPAESATTESTTTRMYYQRYHHTGSEEDETVPLISRNDYVLRLAFQKKTDALNESTDPSYPWRGSFPTVSYSIIQTA